MALPLYTHESGYFLEIRFFITLHFLLLQTRENEFIYFANDILDVRAMQ